MDLLIVRHAPAGRRRPGATSEEDFRRPLTEAGRRKMRRAAAGLRRLAPKTALLASSPLARAVQTAEILGKVLGAEPVRCDALRPGTAPEALVAWLRSRKERGLVALVGHEPHLGSTVAWLLCGRSEPLCLLKKGAACLLEFPGVPGRGRGRLRWLLQPAQLRALA